MRQRQTKRKRKHWSLERLDTNCTNSHECFRPETDRGIEAFIGEGVAPFSVAHVLTQMAKSCYRRFVEIINVKVPDGTKAKLRQINRNVSALVREQIDALLERNESGGLHARISHLCGIIKGGPKSAATSKEYLKQYGRKRAA